MDEALRSAVRRRADWRCEYCLLPESIALVVPFHIEHVVARQHAGPTSFTNLALACHRCNQYKGTNLAGLDPWTGRLARLFHPRRMRWGRHFRWDGVFLVGLTPTGRATVSVLRMNVEERLDLRTALTDEGLFPPPLE